MMNQISGTIEIAIQYFEGIKYREQKAILCGDWAVFREGKRWNITYICDGFLLAYIPKKQAALWIIDRLHEKLKTSPYDDPDTVKDILLEAIMEFGSGAIWEVR